MSRLNFNSENICAGFFNFKTSKFRLALARCPIGRKFFPGDEVPTGNGYIRKGGIPICLEATINEHGLRIELLDLDKTWYARGGSIGPIQYGVVYDEATRQVLATVDLPGTAGGYLYDGDELTLTSMLKGGN